MGHKLKGVLYLAYFIAILMFVSSGIVHLGAYIKCSWKHEDRSEFRQCLALKLVPKTYEEGLNDSTTR